ncbi:MAG: multicopper oxidase family protein [Rhodanobacteraceae bacterium]|nr:MAG: multicopper oxidase family protein [Rhodanobacteraceae bacterium]
MTPPGTTNHLITRRDFLRYAGAGAAALLAGWPELRAAAPPAGGFEPDLWLDLAAAPQKVGLRAGPATPVWAYRPRVLKGDPASVEMMPGGYLGPILRVQRGQKLRIDFLNHIGQPSIVNWHGLHLPADMLGLPRYEVGPGQRYRYEFEVRNRASTCWYHAMSAGHTPEQVYFGLAGLLVVSDKDEEALPLPRGEYDVPVIIQDRDWGGDNRLHYPLGAGPDAAHAGDSAGEVPGTGSRAMMGGGMMGGGMMGGGMMGGGMMGGGMMRGGMGNMMTRMMGFFGDTIFVNGRPDATLEVAAHAYRLRVLNASNARTYKLAWHDGRPLVVLATGGGLLEAPLSKDYVMLTPGQRVELWADFSNDAVGTQLTLMSLAFKGSIGRMGGGMMGEMGRMMSHSSLPDGAHFPVLKVAVTHKVKARLELPRRLSTVTRLRAEDAANRGSPRTFRVTMGHMQWGFNGRSYQPDQVAADEIVKLNTTEIWEFENNMMMAHAIHLHGLQFQVLERRNSPEGGGVIDGCVDEGWEDTVLLMPNERVKLIMRFVDFAGTYAYQCHMLEHAADGLMREYRVAA